MGFDGGSGTSSIYSVYRDESDYENVYSPGHALDLTFDPSASNAEDQSVSGAGDNYMTALTFSYGQRILFKDENT